MNNKQSTVISITLAFLGWCVLQYAYIPDFTFLGYTHIQPSANDEHKYSAVMYFIHSLAFFNIGRKYWHTCIICVFLMFGFANHMLDELNSDNYYTGSKEVASLLFVVAITILFSIKRFKLK